MSSGGPARGITATLFAGICLCACSTGPSTGQGEQALAGPLELRMAPPATSYAEPVAAIAGAVPLPPSPAGLPAAFRAPDAGGSPQLEQAVHAALAYHPSIDEAVARVLQGEAEIGIARAGYLPTLDGGIDASYQGGGRDRDGWTPTLNLSGSQMLYDFGKVSNRVRSREAEARIGRAELLLGADRLIRDTANAFIEVQRNQALVEAAGAQLRGIEAIAALVRHRSDQGASTQSDRVQAEARVAAAATTLLELTGQLRRWQSTLANLTGMPAPAATPGTVPSWLADACNVPEPDWARTPAVLRAQSQMEQAQAERALSRAEAMPTLSLEAGGKYDLANSSSGWLRDDPAEFTVGVKLRGRLYEGGASAARRRAAEHALTSAEAAIRTSRIQISGALTQARAQVDSLKRMVATLASRDDMMQRTRDLYRQQYVELGTRSLLDLLNAEQELHQSAFARIDAVHDLYRLGVDCLHDAGLIRARFGLDGARVRGVELRL